LLHLLAAYLIGIAFLRYCNRSCARNCARAKAHRDLRDVARAIAVQRHLSRADHAITNSMDDFVRVLL
jgi:hypothetical protein